jgi:hypothetical protein
MGDPDLFVFGIAASAAAVSAAALAATFWRRVRAGGDRAICDLPGALLDDHRVTIESGFVALSGRRLDGRGFRILIDPRHAHALSDQLLLLAAQAAPRQADGPARLAGKDRT